jgi:hypothetical protein
MMISIPIEKLEEEWGGGGAIDLRRRWGGCHGELEKYEVNVDVFSI